MSEDFWDGVSAVAGAARNPVSIVSALDRAPIQMHGGTITGSHSEVSSDRIYVPAGGKITAAWMLLSDGAQIRALPEGGFVIETLDADM